MQTADLFQKFNVLVDRLFFFFGALWLTEYSDALSKRLKIYVIKQSRNEQLHSIVALAVNYTIRA